MGYTRSATYDAYRRPVLASDETGRSTTLLYRPGNQSYPAMASTFAQPGLVLLPGDGPGTPRQIHTYFTPDRWVQIRYSAVGTAEASWAQQTQDSLGRVRLAWDSTGRGAVETTYEARGFVYETFDPAHRRTWYEYDNAGNVLTTHLPDTRTLGFTYDDLGRALTATDQKGQTITKTYHPSGSVQTLKDARNKIYTFEIDALGRQRKLIYPADQNGVVREETITYGVDGLVKAKTDRKGTLWDHFEYDHRGRLFNQEPPVNAPGERNYGRELNYDPAGRVYRLTNNVDAQVSWGYDPAGRVEWESQYHSDINQARTVHYTYDTPGRRWRMAYPNGWFRVDYGYNGRDQISSVQGGDGTSVFVGATFGYALDGQMNRITRSNGVETTMGFDPTGRVSSHTHKLGANLLASRGYEYDDLHRLTDYIHGSVAAGTPEDGRRTRFAYYPDGQLQTGCHDATQVNPVGGPAARRAVLLRRQRQPHPRRGQRWLDRGLQQRLHELRLRGEQPEPIHQRPRPVAYLRSQRQPHPV